MNRHKFKGRKRNKTQNFVFENLEPRQLLAADILMLTTDVQPAEPAVTQVVSLENDAAHDAKVDVDKNRRRKSLIPVANAQARTFDGVGNNETNVELGSAGQQLLRIAGNDYADGISELAGEDRVSARVISNVLAAQDPENIGNERGLSAFVYVWGQFLDHDLGLTPTNSEIVETADILVPAGDPSFDPDATGTQTISFTRSVFDIATGTDVDNPREQLNELTSFVDGSMIYGADDELANRLRSFEGGRLLVGDDGLPPVDEHGFFIAGDERANENIELTSMHTLFIREHNLWADRIAAENSNMSDEAIFQQARSIVIGEIQAITYNEFLPALLGEDAIADYKGYNSTVNPGIANEFSTAAYRLHTTINDDIEFFGNDGRAVGEEVALSEAFFNPDLLRETGINSILKYVASSQGQELDLQIVDSLRNFLFGQPGSGGLDLASLNIQRGRDHGLADYNSTREAYGLDRVGSFADISSNVETQQMLAEVYDNVDEIDLWVGLFAEDHMPNSSMGETAQTIVVDQFERVRDGDRFWYENIFSGRSLAMIDNTTLADVIERNSEAGNLQENVFFMNAEVTGQVYSDRNGDERQDRRERGIAYVDVELVSDEGEVLETTQTDRRGFYRFENFLETGDYEVRVVLPNGATATSSTTALVLVSRGGQTIKDVNFGIASDDGGHDRDRDRKNRRHQSAVDFVFSDFGLDDDDRRNRRGLRRG